MIVFYNLLKQKEELENRKHKFHDREKENKSSYADNLQVRWWGFEGFI